jgi:hypothetical protein
MAKIRQEINMLNATITATSVSFVVFNRASYSNSVTYSFEIVGKVTSGTSTITCQRNGTSTNDATVSLTETSFTRKRVTLTPPIGITRYRVGISGGTGPQIIAARILVFQDSTSESLYYTETQIEIGNQETQTSATAVPLTAPKYWYYDSSKWDSDLQFFAEVVGKRDTSTASSSNWILQEDDGSFGTWTDKVTIAASITSTTANDYRVQFTPTTGRNYRIVSLDSNTLNGGHITYNAKIIAVRNLAFAQVGNSLAISTVGNPALAALSSSRVAFIDNTNDSLRAYDFDGTNWAQVGNSLAISTVGNPALAALSSSRVAFIDATNDSLRAYDFDGTNWAQVGNSLAISNVGLPALAALSSSRVAFIDGDNDSLRAYDFDGTNWAQVGNSLAISTVGNPALAALSSSRVAFIDNTNDSLRAYDFDGTNWAQVGNSLAISGVGAPALAALSSSRVAFIDATNDSLRAYDFDGTNWAQVGNSLAISNVGAPALAALSSSRVAFIDGDNDSLRAYDSYLLNPTKRIEPQYLLINQQVTATGLANFDTLFDPAEWGGTANSYYHETNADGAASAVKLQTDPNGTPADISSSTATGENRQRTAALTMPSTSETIDANVTNIG